MNKILIVLCVSLLWLGGLAESAEAYSGKLTATFYLDGIDLDLGEIYTLPNTLLIVYGTDDGLIKAIERQETPNFPNSVDIYFEFDFTDINNPVPTVVVFHEGDTTIDGVVVLEDMSISDLNLSEYFDQFGDVADPIPFDENSIVIFSTTGEEYFILWNFIIATTPTWDEDNETFTWPINFEVLETTGEVIPEPSTLLLLGLGLLGLIGFGRRRKGKMKGMFFVLIGTLLAGLLIVAVSVARAADGDLDPTFSDDGILTTDVGGWGSVNAVAIQSDGKIVVAGDTGGEGGDFVVLRYTPEGILDTTNFGTPNGYVTTGLSDYESGNAIAIDVNGRIVVVGSSYYESDFVVLRYTSTGILDEGDDGFDGDGIVTTNVGSNDSGNALAIDAEGRIVVAGSSGGNVVVLRYDEDGSLDNGYDGFGFVPEEEAFYGYVITDLGEESTDSGNAVAIDDDGNIVVVGTGENDVAVLRYDEDGDLDSTFGDGGIVTTHIGGESTDSGNAVAIDAEGRIVVVGTSNNDVAVLRYDQDGNLDDEFGDGGIVTTDLGESTDSGNAVAIDIEGRIVVVGTGGYNVAVLRYDEDGDLDSTFGDGGIVTTHIGRESTDSGNAVAIDADGNIVVVGTSDSNVAVLRYIGVSEPALPFESCESVTGISIDDCETLVALYDNTDGDYWTNNNNWLQTNTPCSWYGVTCTGGYVTQLNLSSNSLNGTLPPEIGNFFALQSLNLSNNLQLGGSLPANLINLNSLWNFNFSETNVCGPPPEGQEITWFGYVLRNWLTTLEIVLESDLTCSSSDYRVHDKYGDHGDNVASVEDRYDVNALPGDENDDYLCWAFSASNILDWGGWEVLDADPDLDTAQNIFNNAYKSHWENKGSIMKYAWNWWLDGTLPPATDDDAPGSYNEEWAQLKDPDLITIDNEDKDQKGRHWPDVEFVNYYSSAWKKNVMAAVTDFLDSGYGVTIRLYDKFNSSDTVGHALTVWGYQTYGGLREESDVIGLLVTDSADDESTLWLLPVTYEAEWIEVEGEWKLFDLKWRVANAEDFGQAIPESYNGLKLLKTYSSSTDPDTGGSIPKGWLIEGVQALKPRNPSFLRVRKAGTGAGSVTSVPDGINCGDDCLEVSPVAPLTLTATPENGSSFAGWAGACSGTGECKVTVDGPKSVIAIFNAPSDTETFRITINLDSTVTTDPAGEVHEIPQGADVTFIFTPVDNYQIVDVVVDGHTVGPVTEYTFPKVGKNHQIEIKTMEKDVKLAMVLKKCIDEDSEEEIECPPGINGTIILRGGDQTCDAECMRVTAEFAKEQGLMVQVIPDVEDSFVGWELSDGTQLDNTEKIYFTTEDIYLRPVIRCSHD